MTWTRSPKIIERQNQARQLHAQGHTYKQIANELHTNYPTVRGWLDNTYAASRSAARDTPRAPLPDPMPYAVALTKLGGQW